VRFVGDDQIEVGRRKELLVLVVEKQRLHRGDNNLRASPVVAVLFINNRFEVGRQKAQRRICLPAGLNLQFEPVHQEQDALGVARMQEELDDGGGDEGLSGAGGHLEQEAVLAFADCGLKAVDGLELIGPEKAQLVGLDIAGAFRFVPPPGLGSVVRALGENDVVVAHLLCDQALRIGRDLLVAGDRVGCRKRGDDVGVAAFEVPEVVQVAVGKDDEAAVLGLGVFAGLLFGDERILVLGFGFEDE